MTIGLFFSRSVSLKLWVDTGLFDREKLIYEEHLRLGKIRKIYWLTYGSEDYELSLELKNSNRLHGDIEVIQMPSVFSTTKLGSWLYSIAMPFIHKKTLMKCDIFKTNQMDGSWSAVFAKWLCNKPLIVRTGYTMTQLMRSKRMPKWKIKFYELVEKFAYANADIAVVTSKHNKIYLENLYGLHNICVLPNFIDTRIFKPLNLSRYDNRLVFVGRLNREKNLFNLIEAIASMGLKLDIYGSGELDNELRIFAGELNAQVNFMGTVPNDELPKIYNKYRYYILTSFAEGMPKTLLEAVSCGCVAIGTNVDGINEVIVNGVNGFLAEDTSAESIKGVIEVALSRTNSFVQPMAMDNCYALSNIIGLEQDIFDVLIDKK